MKKKHARIEATRARAAKQAEKAAAAKKAAEAAKERSAIETITRVVKARKQAMELAAREAEAKAEAEKAAEMARAAKMEAADASESAADAEAHQGVVRRARMNTQQPKATIGQAVPVEMMVRIESIRTPHTHTHATCTSSDAWLALAIWPCFLTERRLPVCMPRCRSRQRQAATPPRVARKSSWEKRTRSERKVLAVPSGAQREWCRSLDEHRAHPRRGTGSPVLHGGEV